MNVAYTWSRAFGICCDNLSDNPPQVQAMDYFKLNEATLSFDRPHNFQASVIAELPFGSGKRIPERRWRDVCDCGRVAGERALQRVLRVALQRDRSRHVAAICPNSTQMADKVKADVQILGNVGAGTSWFDPLAFRAGHRTALRQRRLQHDARSGIREPRLECPATVQSGHTG